MQDDIEPDGVDAIRELMKDEPDRDTLKAEFAVDQRVRSEARQGDFWVGGGIPPTAGWYASWYPDEVYYRTQGGVWMTSHFKEEAPTTPVHKLGPARLDGLFPDETNNLIRHARRELEIVGEEHTTIDGILRILQAFSDMGHSGGSASVVIPWLNTLLSFRNIRPLTDDPDEWMDVAGFDRDGGPLWQSRRRSDAFSTDGGKTYYTLEEGREVIHTSQPHEKQEEPDGD